jgi:hypothetical protein
MPANDVLFRTHATNHFLTHGLGGKLSHDASIIIESHALESSAPGQRELFVACGSMLERIFWVGLGHWLGYFQPEIQPLSTTEKAFLVSHAEQLRQYPWPSDFLQVFELLVNPETNSGTRFFSEQIVGSALDQGSKELWPAFQAAHIISESLTEGPIRSFFDFLQNSDLEEFSRQKPSPQAVFNSLQNDGSDDNQVTGFSRRDAVVAGFIRYAEFLSAMDSLFPSTGVILAKRETDLTPEEKMLHAIFGEKTLGKLDAELPAETGHGAKMLRDREVLAQEIRGIIQWRIPRNARARAAHWAVHSAFAEMASEEFLKNSSSGVSWSATNSFREFVRLSSRFFGVLRPRRLQVPKFHADTAEHLTEPELRTNREQRTRGIESKQSATEAGAGEFELEE